jgi:hypothetical protein
MKTQGKETRNRFLSMPMMGVFGLLLAFKPYSTSSIVSGFYADGYAVDLFMLAIAIAFIAIMIIIKFRDKNRES